MQIYGAFKYKWDEIQVLKTPLSQVTVVEPRSMSPRDFEGKEVDVFEMKLETAQGRVMEFIQQQEVAKGQRLFMQRYGADEADVVASIDVTSFRVRRVYHPAFVFHLRHLDQEFVVMVNGATGAVWGQYIYDATKVGGAAFLAGSALWLVGGLMHLVSLSFTSYVLTVLIPSVLAGVVGKYWAHIRQYIREARRVVDREADAALKAGAQQAWYQQQAGFGEQRRTEERYEQAYRRQYGSQQQQWQQAARPRPPPTPTKS
jgi:hypothetical protein